LSISIQPNPVKNQLIIESEFTILNIHDVTSKLIYKDVNPADFHEIDTSNWPQGVYLLELKLFDSRTLRQKILKQ